MGEAEGRDPLPEHRQAKPRILLRSGALMLG